MTGASSSTEVAFSRLAGLTCLAVGGRGLAADPTLSPVRICLALLHGLAAWLFLRRDLERTAAPRQALLASLPVFVAALWLFRQAPPPPAWPPVAVAVFVAATGWTFASLATLGRSFAILPGLRTVVTRGPYLWLRHPAYAGEWALLGGCVLARPSSEGVLAWFLAGLLFGVRIRGEEQLLSTTESYQRYCERVRFRLIPGLW